MTNQRNLFGEQVHEIQIEGNPLLAMICRHILELRDKYPDRIENAKSIGEIDRFLLVAVWLDDGLRSILKDEELRKQVTAWMLDPKKCLDPDAIGRARRYLMERGKFAVPTQLITDAERHRARIAKSVKT